jgi:hypothetical protein
MNVFNKIAKIKLKVFINNFYLIKENYSLFLDILIINKLDIFN